MGKRKNGELEAAVLDILWADSTGMTVSELQASFAGTQPAYTTMMTVLGRMEDKGLIVRERRGRSLFIHPMNSRSDFVASTMTAALHGADDVKGVLAAFAGSLDNDELRILRTLVDN